MRLRQNHDGILLLNGRRIDLEEGQDGLWLGWLVGGLFLIAGILIFAFGELFGLVAIGFGLLVLGIMAWLLCRREYLICDHRQREVFYSTSFWPFEAQLQWQLPYDKLRGVELHSIVENVKGITKSRRSLPYQKTQACLLLPGNSKLELDRHASQERVRQLAEDIAIALGLELIQR